MLDDRPPISLLDRVADDPDWPLLTLGRGATRCGNQTEPGRHTRRLRWDVDPVRGPAVALAVVAAVLGAHTAQRRFRLAANLGRDGGPVFHVGVDLTTNPPVGALASAAAAVSAQAGHRQGRGVAEPGPVRHHHGGRGPKWSGPLDILSEVDGAELVLTVVHDRDAVDDSEATVLLAHLATALADVRDGADPPVSELRLAGTAEAAAISEWETGPAPAPAALIHELVAAQAHLRPAAPAVIGPAGRLTYAELDSAAESAAARLVRLGVGAESLVAIYAERSVELVVALLAVLKAGGAYLSLDPGETPADRLAEIMRDTAPRLLLTDREDATPGAAVRLTAVVHPTDPAPLEPVRIDVRNLAYVSYTSGSTGRPKGVAVTHEAVARLVLGPTPTPFGPGETVLWSSPVAFDASTFEIWGPLCAGGRVVISPPGAVRLDELAGLVRRTGVTTAWFTAGLFHQLVDGHPETFAGLRHVLAGGDVVSARHVRLLRATHPELRFTNGYGPTENTTFTTCWSGDLPAGRDTVPVGVPIQGTRVRILDADLRPVPVGVWGELHAGGAGLARGYLDRPGLTADRFVPDPRGGGERLYRTGDIVRWRPDGAVEFRGREDRQVKIRGFRVEPAEVEAVLGAQPEVRQAAVVVESDDPAARRLVGYVVLADAAPGEQQDTAVRLRRRLTELLPSYLVPSFVIPLAELPVTASGKVDRTLLSAGVRADRPLADPYLEPRGLVEETLAGIWSGLLRVSPVGVEDNFFELGGNSLTVSQLIIEVEAAFGQRLKARTVFLEPTIARLATQLTESAAGPGGGVR